MGLTARQPPPGATAREDMRGAEARGSSWFSSGSVSATEPPSRTLKMEVTPAPRHWEDAREAPSMPAGSRGNAADGDGLCRDCVVSFVTLASDRTT